MAEVSIRARLDGADEVQRGLGDIESKLGGVTNAANNASGGISKSGAAVTGFLGGIAGGLVVTAISKFTSLLHEIGPGSIQAAMEAEQANNQIRSALRATEHVAAQTETQLNATAEALSMKTGFDDESIKLAEAQVLSFTSIVGENFTRVINLSTDLAAKMNTDVPSAARVLALATESPERGARALRVANVILHDSEIKLLEDFKKKGDILSGQEYVLNRVEKAIGGTAEGQNKGLTGAVRALANAWDEFQEALGGNSGVQNASLLFVTAITSELERAQRIISSPSFREGLKEFFMIGTREERDISRAGGVSQSGTIKRADGSTAASRAAAAVQEQAFWDAQTALGIKNLANAEQWEKERREAAKQAIDSMRQMRDSAKEQQIAFEDGDIAALKYSLSLGSLSEQVRLGGSAAKAYADEIININEKLYNQKLATEQVIFLQEDMVFHTKQITDAWAKMDSVMAFRVAHEEAKTMSMEIKDLTENTQSFGNSLAELYKVQYGDGKRAFLDIKREAEDTVPWIDELKDAVNGFSKDLATNLVGSLNKSGSALEKFKNMVTDVMNTIAVMVTKRLITDPLEKGISGVLNSILGGFGPSGDGYTGGIDFSGGGVDFSGPGIQLPTGSTIPGFANGGSFTVGGTGGIDSQKVSFKATPGEKVSIGNGTDRVGGAQINVTINAVDAPSVQNLLMNNQNLIVGMVDRAFNKQGKRGTRG